MTLAFIDTEFNGFGGDLISMALVMEDGGAEWYEVLWAPPDYDCDPWVWENVVPRLGKSALGPVGFYGSLHAFLSLHRPTTVVADWPSDLAHLFQSLIGYYHGRCLKLEISGQLVYGFEPTPQTPHNALSDARALRDAVCGAR